MVLRWGKGSILLKNEPFALLYPFQLNTLFKKKKKKLHDLITKILLILDDIQCTVKLGTNLCVWNRQVFGLYSIN
jgi:ABC-type proline/glycine betaine transport system ATPase subunit